MEAYETATEQSDSEAEREKELFITQKDKVELPRNDELESGEESQEEESDGEEDRRSCSSDWEEGKEGSERNKDQCAMEEVNVKWSDTDMEATEPKPGTKRRMDQRSPNEVKGGQNKKVAQ